MNTAEGRWGRQAVVVVMLVNSQSLILPPVGDITVVNMECENRATHPLGSRV